MKRWAIVVIIIPCVRVAQAFEVSDTKTDLLRILDLLKEAWNRQDMEGFMAYY